MILILKNRGELFFSTSVCPDNWELTTFDEPSYTTYCLCSRWTEKIHLIC